jgi:uncharacterized protein (DUF362 family)
MAHSEDYPRRGVSRREAILRIAGSLAGASTALGLGAYLYEAPGFRRELSHGAGQVRDFRTLEGPVEPRLAIAKSSTNAKELVARAVGALGGMNRFVSRGDIVAVKPNIGWDRVPAQAANTNPEVVAAVVELCFEAGAKEVVVTDASCNEARRSFQRSGIWRAAYGVGARVVLPAENRFRRMRLRGELLDEWPVYTPLLEADKLINVPVIKHHNLSRYTGAMKNWYGVLGGRRNRLHQSIDLSIADLATFMRPTLTILDATRVLIQNGPQGGNLNDTLELHQVIATLDEVAGDTYGASLIGVNPAEVGFLKLGAERGLGVMSFDGAKVV